MAMLAVHSIIADGVPLDAIYKLSLSIRETAMLMDALSVAYKWYEAGDQHDKASRVLAIYQSLMASEVQSGEPLDVTGKTIMLKNIDSGHLSLSPEP